DPPPDNAGNSDSYERYNQSTLFDSHCEERHENHCHGKPIPEEPGIVGAQMVVGRSKCRGKDSEEDNSRGQVAELDKAHETNHREGQVRDEIPEVTDAGDGTAVGERMIALVLR